MDTIRSGSNQKLFPVRIEKKITYLTKLIENPGLNTIVIIAERLVPIFI
jgi:hypothetical protein